MPDLRLIPIDAALERSLARGEAAFEAEHAARLGACADVAREVVAQNLALLARRPRAAPFGAYLAEQGGEVVGTCAFPDGPSAGREPEVEIAYFTFPPFEGRGVGRALAAALVRIALEHGGLARVIAHTLPERNASGRILERNGFRCAGPFQHPEDGTVWRWELDVPPRVRT